MFGQEGEVRFTLLLLRPIAKYIHKAGDTFSGHPHSNFGDYYTWSHIPVDELRGLERRDVMDLPCITIRGEKVEYQSGTTG